MTKPCSRESLVAVVRSSSTETSTNCSFLRETRARSETFLVWVAEKSVGGAVG